MPRSRLKNAKKKRRTQENRAAESVRQEPRWMRDAVPWFEQHQPGICWNRAKGKNTVPIPRFIQHAGQTSEAKIKGRMEASKIVSERGEGEEERQHAELYQYA